MRKFDNKYQKDNESENQENKSNEYEEGEIFNIKTYKDGTNSYEVYLSYKKNMKKFFWEIEEFETLFSFNNTQIIKAFTHINKGAKLLIITTEDNKVTVLNEDLELQKQFNLNDIYESLNPEFNQIQIKNFHMFQNFISFIHNFNSILISSFENMNNLILKCDLSKNATSTINNFIFDSYNHLIYAILNDGNFLVISPKLFGNTHYKDNYCIVNKIYKLDIANEFMQMEILRKDLILRNKETIIVIDLSDFEELDTKNEELKFRKFDLTSYKRKDEILIQNSEKHIDLPNFEKKHFFENNKLVFCKSNNGHYIFTKRNNDNTLLLLEIVNPTGKLKGNEEFSFNFKIPIIFIALIILFFFHYFKKKQPEESDDMIKQDILEKIKKFGTSKNPTIGKRKKSEEDFTEETVSDKPEDLDHKIRNMLRNKK